ncbi:hypothetical protein [Stieleria mannarensis]|uniref:hypothetical protein n=1 Tax=Stieleria mannarensis TaxID=2755585 RepID=UPI001603DC0B|nr:hypothetical protein [Rhodopirellula sp. JC639]
MTKRKSLGDKTIGKQPHRQSSLAPERLRHDATNHPAARTTPGTIPGTQTEQRRGQIQVP